LSKSGFLRRGRFFEAKRKGGKEGFKGKEEKGKELRE